MKHPIDELYKQKAEGIEIKPNPAVWNKIESQLATQPEKGFAWWRVAAAVVVLLTGWFTVNEMRKTVDQPEIEFHVADETLLPIDSNTLQTPAIKPVQPEIIELENASNHIADAPSKENRDLKSNRAAQKPETKKPLTPQPELNYDLVESEMEIADAPTTEMMQQHGYNFSLSINNYDYYDEVGFSMPSAQKPKGLMRYAQRQWQNLREGEGLEAPTTSDMGLPGVELNIEGNPVKRWINNLRNKNENQ